jgi:hypothetical protein
MVKQSGYNETYTSIIIGCYNPQMRWFTIVCLLSAAPAVYGQQGPDVAAQRDAMKKLSFLAGMWTGEASVMTQNGPAKVQQTESVAYKLDGLAMLVEGTGRNPETGEVKFQAMAVITYDDSSHAYRFRSYNEGRT